jgi:hypothetical protein
MRKTIRVRKKRTSPKLIYKSVADQLGIKVRYCITKESKEVLERIISFTARKTKYGYSINLPEVIFNLTMFQISKKVMNEDANIVTDFLTFFPEVKRSKKVGFNGVITKPRKQFTVKSKVNSIVLSERELREYDENNQTKKVKTDN